MAVNLYSQTEKNNTVGVYAASGIFVSMGGAGITSVGVDYSRRLSEDWSLSVGFEQNALGLCNILSYSDRPWQITSIPVLFKHHKKRVDFKYGPVVSAFNLFDTWDTAWLLGWEYGVCFNREFNNGIALYLNPYTRFNFVSIRNSGYANMHAGVSLGIGYKF